MAIPPFSEVWSPLHDEISEYLTGNVAIASCRDGDGWSDPVRPRSKGKESEKLARP
jgi:hypothetical protein